LWILASRNADEAGVTKKAEIEIESLSHRVAEVRSVIFLWPRPMGSIFTLPHQHVFFSQTHKNFHLQYRTLLFMTFR
jgi:hypothetical protein